MAGKKKRRDKKLGTAPSETARLDVAAAAGETTTVITGEDTPPSFNSYETLTLVTVENTYLDDGTTEQRIFSDEVVELHTTEGRVLDAELIADEADVLTPEEVFEAPVDAQIDESVTLTPVEAYVLDIGVDEYDSLTPLETYITDYYVCPLADVSALFVCIETARTTSSTSCPEDSVVNICVDELIGLVTIESSTLPARFVIAEPAILTPSDISLLNAAVPETAELSTTEYTLLNNGTLTSETTALKIVETSLVEVDLSKVETETLKLSEISHADRVDWVALAYHEIVHIKTHETSLCELFIEYEETFRLLVTERTDAYKIPTPVVRGPPVDYTLEVRQKHGASYDFLGVIENRIAPSIQRELGMADVLSFNMQLKDPKHAMLLNPVVGKEIWYYGRDAQLKQIFTIQNVEPYRDYGGSGGGSGGASLGGGSGDNILIVADGPESYLTMYQIKKDYKVYQRHVSDIINDLFGEIRADGYVTGVYIEPNLNIPLDIDLSWENLKTAVDNIINQVGGVMRLRVDSTDHTKRILELLPIAGGLPQPRGTGSSGSSGGLLVPGVHRYGDSVLSADASPLIVFDVFPKQGNFIRNNTGSGGEDYDANAFKNNYMQLKNGATAWQFSDESDSICIPSGVNLMNLQDMTIEFSGYIGTQTVSAPRLFYKKQWFGAFELIYDAINYRLKLRRCTFEGDTAEWVSADNSVPPNDWYYMQLIWESGIGPDAEHPPSIFLDNVLLELTYDDVIGTWAGDFPNDLYIGNTADLTSNFVGIISMFRVYGAALIDGSTNFIKDGWRRDPSSADIMLDVWTVPGERTAMGVLEQNE